MNIWQWISTDTEYQYSEVDSEIDTSNILMLI